LIAAVRQVDLEKKISRLGAGDQANDDPEPFPRAGDMNAPLPPIQAARVVGLIIGSPEFQRY
jgi:hypothetical protein